MQYVRNPDVSVTDVDNEIFLVEPDADEIYYLDEVGSGVWRLLESPCSVDEMVETFLATFPDVPESRIRTDVRNIIDDMLRARVILAAT